MSRSRWEGARPPRRPKAGRSPGRWPGFPGRGRGRERSSGPAASVQAEASVPGAKNVGKREQGSPGQETSAALLTSPSRRQLSAARGPHAGRLVGAGLRGPRPSFFLCSTSLCDPDSQKTPSPGRSFRSQGKALPGDCCQEGSQLLHSRKWRGLSGSDSSACSLLWFLPTLLLRGTLGLLGWWEATFFLFCPCWVVINPTMRLINPLWGAVLLGEVGYGKVMGVCT